VKLKKQEMVEADNAEGLTLEVQPTSVEPALKKLSMPERKPEGSEETIYLNRFKCPSKKRRNASCSTNENVRTETVSQESSNCKYGFGYLGQRKKGEEYLIPA